MIQQTKKNSDVYSEYWWAIKSKYFVFTVKYFQVFLPYRIEIQK